MKFDVVIIGAGVVGLACAAELSKKFDNVLLVERWPHPGEETSSRNSEVIHAGIYYPENSLKAKLCVSGKESLYEYAQKYKIPYKNCGKLIVAVNQDQVTQLDQIKSQAKKNGVELEIVDQKYVLQKEANVKCEAALWSSTTGIIDSWELMKTLEAEAVENACEIVYSHELIGIEKKKNWVLDLRTIDGDEFKIECDFLVNSAGLDSDTIAEMAGIDVDENNLRLNYAIGHYFKLSSKFNNYVSTLIYPVPQKNTTSLGVHLTIDLGGGIRIGPDVKFMEKREQVFPVPVELRSVFFEAANTYLKNITEKDLHPDYSGIRPKLQKKGEPQRDFYIKREENDLINLIGIESPGLTCCIEISKFVSSLIDN